MFKQKYTISIIDSKWNSIKRNLKVDAIPRKGEFIFFEEYYYNVVSVIHQITKKEAVIIVVDKQIT